MLCSKCKMRSAEDNFHPLCYICGLKAKEFYRSAIQNLTNPHTGEIGGWWGFHTNWDFKVGWSIKNQIGWLGAMLAVLKMECLNKNPKTTTTLRDYVSEYWLKRFGWWKVSDVGKI